MAFAKLRWMIIRKTIYWKLFKANDYSDYCSKLLLMVMSNIRRSKCYILTFGLSKMPFKVMHRKEVIHSNGSYERKSGGRKLADEMGRAKNIPWYIHRLKHRKRETSALHDSYFRLMTIKHSISKIEWVSNVLMLNWIT